MGLLKKLKYATFGKLNMKKYWHDRYEQYYDMRGSGKAGLTNTENKIVYKYYEDVFENLLSPKRMSLKVLDVGCGIGYYTKFCENKNVLMYCGIDISKKCIDHLNSKYKKCNNFTFRQIDFTKDIIACDFEPNIILCMDVTQHIISDNDFEFLMNQFKNSLDYGAVLIITSHLKSEKYSFYEIGRDIHNYKSIFKKYKFGIPVRYRDKWIFSISKFG